MKNYYSRPPRKNYQKWFWPTAKCLSCADGQSWCLLWKSASWKVSSPSKCQQLCRAISQVLSRSDLLLVTKVIQTSEHRLVFEGDTRRWWHQVKQSIQIFCKKACLKSSRRFCDVHYLIFFSSCRRHESHAQNTSAEAGNRIWSLHNRSLSNLQVRKKEFGP